MSHGMRGGPGGPGCQSMARLTERERERQPIIPIANLELQINVFAQWKKVSKS